MENFIQQNIWIIPVVVAWTLPWKGVALWKAARLSQKKWFVALLIINTLGMLEILYIFIFSKRKSAPESKGVESSTSSPR
ncbi:MAG: DUF5652 family protein [Patescibacteria group bacterium]